ncbi:hypothetical protein LT17_05315 [Pseudomonas aeruginosa]|nr:hypothetical protein LT17_05315 [Pseudomonas aeruginosa]
MGAGKGIQPSGLLRVEQLIVIAVTISHWFDLTSKRLHQPRRCIELGELLLPETPGGILILTLQPGDIVAIAPRQRRRQATRIPLQHLAEQARATPAVHQNVMVRIDQMMSTFARANNRDPQQRLPGQVEPLAPHVLRIRLQRLLKVLSRTPVENLEGQPHLLVDQLQRPLQVRQYVGPQHLVTGDGRQPGLVESLDVQSFHVHSHLVDVVASALLVQGVEKHPLLHWRQRIKVGDLACRNWQSVKSGLVEVRQGKVRWCHATVALLAAMFHKSLELPSVLIRERLYGLLVEHFPAEGPAQAQLAVVDPPVDAQQCAQRRLLVHDRTTILPGRREQSALLIEAAIELA